ncbi:MAG: arginine--tRNA ligase [Mollicutes bacterium]|nr:arginine--tRNA ligase [Mollicutes bacterium]
MTETITALINEALKKMGITDEEVSVEVPKTKENGDYSSNIGMRLAKKFKKRPMEIAQEIAFLIKNDNIEKIAIVEPGFINFYLKKDYLFKNINTILKEKNKYGSSLCGKGKKINIEFVSANPTGILHVGNARGAAYGDSLARILKFLGYDVTKEYYMNDAGVQVNKLGKSIKSNYLDLCKIENEFPEDGYPGKEIKQIAEQLYEKYKCSLKDNDLDIFKDAGIKYISDQIFQDLKEFRVEYDTITSEKEIREKYSIKDLIKTMRKNGYIYEKDGATWFKSSDIYDTEDRVLIKSDGNPTYIVPDILYHQDKFKRGFDRLYTILGTDHHGYVPRMKSSLKALDYDDSKLDVKLLQLVRIVKNNKVVTMHKREGNIIYLRDLIREVGVNASRYYFSKSSLDTQMDFDIELAKSKTNENPIYYVSYAYARMCSILNVNKEITNIEEYKYIKDDTAIELLSLIYRFPEIVKKAGNKEEPHLITNYIFNLATLFHSFYEKYRIITDNKTETNENLNLLKATKITLFNALNLIGVIPEERM